MAEITIIPAKNHADEIVRTAAYARVSSDSEDQLNSFAAQNRYYAELISGKAEWRMVDIYADEGITGTSAAKRFRASCARGSSAARVKSTVRRTIFCSAASISGTLCRRARYRGASAGKKRRGCQHSCRGWGAVCTAARPAFLFLGSNIPNVRFTPFGMCVFGGQPVPPGEAEGAFPLSGAAGRAAAKRRPSRPPPRRRRLYRPRRQNRRRKRRDPLGGPAAPGRPADGPDHRPQKAPERTAFSPISNK